MKNINRTSKILRHAEKVCFIGDSEAYPSLLKFLKTYFQELGVFTSLNNVPDINLYDSLILTGSAKDTGIANVAELESIALNRQVLCDIPLFAELIPDNLLLIENEHTKSTVNMKDAYFLNGFSNENSISWESKKHFKQGEAFGYKSPDEGLKIALMDANRNIYAVSKEKKNLLISSFDLSIGEELFGKPEYLHFSHFVLEAVGAKSVNMGCFNFPWLSYDAFIGNLEEWTSVNDDLVNVELLEPKSVSGESLRLVTIGNKEKPALLFTCATHGHEWGPCYGYFNYFRYLLEALRSGDNLAKQVLDNFHIAWIPIVNVDGFKASWERGLIVPHSNNNVDLNRNFPPYENWEKFAKNGDRNGGPEMASEPETKAVAAVMKKLGKNGRLFIDNHECVETEIYITGRPSPFIQEFETAFSKVFNKRYLTYGLSGYKSNLNMEFANLRKINYKISENSKPYLYNYAHHCGFEDAALSEFWGNDDLTPYSVIGRTDAIATFLETIFKTLLK